MLSVNKEMYRSVVILVALLFSMAFCATADEIVADSTKIGRIEKVKEYISSRPKKNDKDLLDSIMKERGKNYWKWAALNGVLDLKDERIVYPKFIKFCINVYNWGDKTFNTYDTAYVVGTGYKWKAMAKNDNWLDNYSLRFNNEMKIRMSSDVNSNIGFSLAYMAVSAGYMFDVGNVFCGRPLTHKRWDFNFCCSLIAADLYYSQNKGATNIIHFGDYNDGQRKWLKHPFQGLKLEAYGADIYYFFNNLKYSQGAAYNYSKIQKKSAGSFIAGITLSAQNVSMNFDELPPEMLNELPNKENTYYRFRYNDYCFLLGYGYNYVPSHHWLINISAMPSIGVKHCMETSIENKKTLFSVNVKAKMAVIYNLNRRWFSGLTGRLDAHWYNSENYSFINAVENLNVCAGFRF